MNITVRRKKHRQLNSRFSYSRDLGLFGPLYEALIIFEIFCEVIARFEERLSFGRLKDVRVDPMLAREIILRMETLSEYIDAHLHSDVFSGVKPSPATLLAEIEAFESMRKAQKDLKKTVDQLVPARRAEPARTESEHRPQPASDSHQVPRPPPPKPSAN